MTAGGDNPGAAQPFPIEAVRARFPALRREIDGQPVVYLDGPAGSQVPQSVADAVSGYLLEHNANLGGDFASSQESDALMVEAGRALADFLGAPAGEEVVFGPNMTTLTFALSQALARGWGPGDEVVVSRLDHDANVTPWVLAAERAGATVRHVPVRAEDCTLDLDAPWEMLGPKTRLVAVGAASNLLGTVNPVAEIAARAHQHGALVFVDAVHYAPHRRVDVAAMGCDFLATSSYKWFGPHQGMLWGRGELLRTLPCDKLRPVYDTIPDRWMPGTQNHEGIAGALAAVRYLADLGRELGAGADRRAALDTAFAAIEAYEDGLCRELLNGLQAMPGVTVHGITDPARQRERVPTIGFVLEGEAPAATAARLGAQGIFCWSGNNYALPLTEALNLEPEGVVRVGLLHYNTGTEVERLLTALRAR